MRSANFFGGALGLGEFDDARIDVKRVNLA
jgi:hypothetical protein